MRKTSEDIKNLIKTKLETSDIILFGTNTLAKEFYMNYKDVYHIKSCVTSKKVHPVYLDENKEMPVITWEEYDKKAADYLVICEGPYVFIENQILTDASKIFEEYVDIDIVRAVLTQRKIVIMAGACQTVVAYDFLSELKGFKKEYMLYKFSTHMWRSKWSVRIISYVKNVCDVYICMRHELDNPKFFKPEELPENCKIITLPSALLRLYWPQMGRNWKGALNPYFKKDTENLFHGPFEYGDENINRMIEEGKNVDEIIECLAREDFYSKTEVEQHVKTMFRMLEYEENECDIKIGNYIRDNYKEKMLYRDMAHMHTCLVCNLVREILRYLHIDTDELDEMERLDNNETIQEYQVHCTEVPVYPSVAVHMGLKWWNKDMVYDVKFYNGLKKMTFEEYIRSYYSVCSKTKQLLEEW